MFSWNPLMILQEWRILKSGHGARVAVKYWKTIIRLRYPNRAVKYISSTVTEHSLTLKLRTMIGFLLDIILNYEGNCHTSCSFSFVISLIGTMSNHLSS